MIEFVLGSAVGYLVGRKKIMAFVDLVSDALGIKEPIQKFFRDDDEQVNAESR